MKLVFAHSTRFVRDGENVYSGSHFGAGIWPRYRAHFNEVVVAARQGSVPAGKAASELELASADGVSFELFANFSSIRGLLIDRQRERPRMRRLVTGADAVIARLPSEIALLAIDCARELGKPWAVEVVGCPWDALWYYGTTAGKLYAPLAWLRMRHTVGKAPFALYVTDCFLQHRYPCMRGVIGCASNVDLPEASTAVLDRRLERIKHDRNRRLKIGLIGSLRTRAKGIGIAMAALARIKGTVRSFTFHILGGGDKERWEELAAQYGIADLVFMEGTLPSGEAVLQWLDDIDLYLQPSLQEGLPRALIEAMSRGCPALGSRKAGIPELLAADDLATPGDVTEFAALLQRRIGDKAWMKERARRNWEAALRYQSRVLDEKRARFWSTFARSSPDAVSANRLPARSSTSA